ncbi:MAG: putative Transporter of family, contains Lipocalin domain [Nitrospira sp.]|jgi:MFS family permease|nr:putative Transporter of family, contains Lipocalin domain [Nitrospira sp.]
MDLQATGPDVHVSFSFDILQNFMSQLPVDPQLTTSEPPRDPETSDDHETRAISRQYGVRDATFQAAAQGGGENYFSAFAVLLHASPFHIGILSALPQLVGMVAQLSSVKLLQYFRMPGRLILAGGWGQALCWLPLLILPLLLPEHGPWLLIGCAMLYFAFGQATTPVWNSLLVELVDMSGRGAYFAHRARVTALTSFIALGVAGVVLTIGQKWDLNWVGFMVIFLGAAAARVGAIHYQTKVSTWLPALQVEPPQGFRHFLIECATADFRYFLLFSGLMHFAVLISGPFFVVYLLRDLHWTYLQYAGWMASSIAAQFLTLTAWGQLGDRYGNKTLLKVTGLAVPLLPMGYLLSDQYVFLLIWNFGGGVIWAGLSLGLQNYVFDSLQPDERTRGVALANAMNAIGWGIGALTGSWLATIIPNHLSFGLWELIPASNLPFVFCLSGALRLLIAISLLGTFGEPRRLSPPPRRKLVWELPLVKPLAALWPWRHPA